MLIGNAMVDINSFIPWNGLIDNFFSLLSEVSLVPWLSFHQPGKEATPRSRDWPLICLLSHFNWLGDVNQNSVFDSSEHASTEGKAPFILRVLKKDKEAYNFNGDYSGKYIVVTKGLQMTSAVQQSLLQAI